MTTLTIPARPAPPAFHRIDVLDACLAGLKPHTLRAYEKDLADFAEFLGPQGSSEGLAMFLDLSGGEANASVLYYRAELAERKLSAATIARKLAAIRSLTKTARILGRITWTIEITAPKAEAYRDTRGPGSDGWKKMLRHTKTKAEAGDSMAVRDLAIVRMAHDLGLRRAELCNLDLEDLDQARGTVAVLGKGRSRKREQTLPDPTIEALTEWLAIRGTAPGPLFHRLDNAGSGDPTRMSGEAIRLIVRRIGIEATGKAVRPHGLRHQAITSVLERNGGDVVAGMKFARHSDPRTTMIYDDNRRDVAGDMARLIAGED